MILSATQLGATLITSLFFALSLYAKECVTLTQARSLVCKALCSQDGADVGWYSEKNATCVCGFEKDFKEMTSVKTFIGVKANAETTK